MAINLKQFRIPSRHEESASKREAPKHDYNSRLPIKVTRYVDCYAQDREVDLLAKGGKLVGKLGSIVGAVLWSASVGEVQGGTGEKLPTLNEVLLSGSAGEYITAGSLAAWAIATAIGRFNRESVLHHESREVAQLDPHSIITPPRAPANGGTY